MTPIISSSLQNQNQGLIAGPVSLLWAYQLRREHALLLSRLDSLAKSTQADASLRAVQELGTRLNQIEAKYHSLEQEHVKIQQVLKEQRQSSASTERRIVHVHELVDQIRVAHNMSTEKLKSEQLELSIRLNSNGADLEELFKGHTSGQKEEMRALKRKVDILEEQVREALNHEINVVRDSMEAVRQSLDKASQSHPQQQPEIRRLPEKSQDHLKNQVSRASDLFRDLDRTSQSNEEAEMWTLKPRAHMQPESTVDTDIDLDENVKKSSHGCNSVQYDHPNDSLMMIPEVAQNRAIQKNGDGDKVLRQGSQQSWTQYVWEGEQHVNASPKRKENIVVEAFVNGMSNPEQKGALEKWLDERHWIWNDVLLFFKPHCAFAEVAQMAYNIDHHAKGGTEAEDNDTSWKYLRYGARSLKPSSPIGISNRTTPDNGQSEQLDRKKSALINTVRRSQRLAERESQQAPVLVDQSGSLLLPGVQKHGLEADKDDPELQKRQNPAMGIYGDHSMIANSHFPEPGQIRKRTGSTKPPRDTKGRFLKKPAKRHMTTKGEFAHAECRRQEPILPQSTQSQSRTRATRYGSRSGTRAKRRKYPSPPIIPILPSSTWQN